MNFFKSWLKAMWPPHRVTPTASDVARMRTLYGAVFNTPAGNELLEFWLETVVLANPRSTDANECIAYTTKCAFVEDIIKAVDRVNNPAKYQEPVANFRKAG